MKSESPYIVINYLNDVVYRAQVIIASMLLDTNSNSYRDEKSGFNLTGLGARLGEISNYQIDQLDAFVAINTKLTDLERLQSEYKVKELQEQRKLLLLKADSNRLALIDYTRLRNQSNTTASTSTTNKGGSDVTGVQINGDAISRLVSLAEESKDAVYRQRLTDERINLENQANDLNTRIAKLERRINFTPNKAIGLTPESKKEYGQLLDKTWSDLSGVISAITRIQVMAQKDFVGDSGLLYTLVSQPEAYSPGRSALKKAGLISIFVALFLSVLFTLVQLFAGKIFSKSEA